MIDTPHFRIPLQRSSGGPLVVIDQDSDEEIVQCVRVILETPLGFREEIPDFGLRDQALKKGGANLEEIDFSIRTSEPRVDSVSTQRLVDTVDNVTTEVRNRHG